MSGKIFLEYDKCKTIFCELKNCNCGKKKSWNRSDKKCGVFRPHGNGIISARNRAKGKYE
jgi:hypothetical protein